VSSILSPQWKEALALSRRGAPEFYESGADIPSGPHAEAIHYALSDLGLAGVFCIEGVPTIGFLNEPNAPLNRIDELHRILWNQGIMSLLLIIRSDELIAYSLAQRPFRREQGTASDPRLISTMSLVVDALKLRELIDSAESGRFWFEHDAFFDPENRVDHVLLSNLLQAFRDMREDLGGDAAQALLMQTMFISYLEDRQIITADVFLSVSNNAYTSLAQIFEARSPQAFESLFVWLKKAFNGNLFNAPCAFEPSDQKPPKLSVEHFSLLARFRRGREEMTSGQLRLWGYDFRYMPVGLISAVYDRFLKEESEKKNADGAFYTPMFLADVVVNQLWDDLTEEQRLDGIYCDPACGSGIFLVRLFQRLVAYHCRTRNKQRASWNDLKAIARRLHGGDINPSAVRVAAFSLYIALLEQSNPPDLPALIKAGKLLPSLYGDTLHPAEDFFATKDGPHYDAVVGNPPWKGRSGQVTTAQTWAKRQGYPDPAKEIAWGFIWKALRVIKPGGLVALLLPAMGILHNTARESQTARRRLLQEAKVRRIINFSDLCFQLFDGAQRPTAFALYGHADGEKAVYRFEYWVPKADLNLRLKRTMTLSCADRLHFRSDFVSEDPTIFKRRLWTRSPDEKLIQYLRTMPPLSAFINEYKDVRKNGFDREREWVIGQGFQPAQESRLSDKNYQTTSSAVVALHPYFDANKFKAVALPTIKSLPWHTVTVRRAGFAGGFSGPHILIPQGVERSMGRARAAYTDQSVVFEHSIQAISFPATAKRTAKLLTAVLNSSLAAWVYFHDTANFGTDRAKIHQSDLLRLPFDIPNNMPNPEIAGIVAGKIVRLIDREIKRADDIFQPQDDVLAEIDALVFSYYGLSDDDIAIVVDTFRYIIPSMQPRRSSGLQPIWANSLSGDRCAYAAALCKALKPWFRQPVSASLSAVSADIAVLKLTVDVNVQEYVENKSTDFNHFLFEMHKNLPITLPGNVQLVPDLRFVVGHDLYLVKPMQLRHWLRSTALADAEQIAAELSAALARQIKDPSHARG
jgi:hypothetical protein